jgi:disulfide bond formation protein DsbB
MDMNDETFYPRRERQALVVLGLTCLALIGGAVYIQVVMGQAPCPLCILQRYALLFIAIFALIGASMNDRFRLSICEGLVAVSAIAGVVAAGRHLWIQIHPTKSCGIDVMQPIVDGLPLASLFPLGFQVAGFCKTPHPPNLGLSLAQWALIAVVSTLILVPPRRDSESNEAESRYAGQMALRTKLSIGSFYQHLKVIYEDEYSSFNDDSHNMINSVDRC